MSWSFFLLFIFFFRPPQSEKKTYLSLKLHPLLSFFFLPCKKKKKKRIWWSAACVPALRAIASGTAGASAFSPSGGARGAGLAAALPKQPTNLIAASFANEDAAVDAAEAAARAALDKVPPRLRARSSSCAPTA